MRSYLWEEYEYRNNVQNKIGIGSFNLHYAINLNLNTVRDYHVEVWFSVALAAIAIYNMFLIDRKHINYTLSPYHIFV